MGYSGECCCCAVVACVGLFSVGRWVMYAVIKIHNVLTLTMDLSKCSYAQALYKINLFCLINYNLKLRKMRRLLVWKMRVGGLWIDHTTIHIEGVLD